VPRKQLAMKYSIPINLRQTVILTFLALSLVISDKVAAQKSPANEAQLKKQANQYFEDEDYTNAFNEYSQLLSLHQDDPNYNYRFGACMLFSQADKKKPIDYIENAVKLPAVENLAYYYLGRAYHLNYRFDDAIRAYNHFRQNASSSDLKKHPVDHLIEMCNNGKQLLSNLHDLDVLRKKELSRDNYYQAYDLTSNGGTLLVEPDDFKTKTDKKKNLTSIIYLSPDRSKLFFSSYGDDDKNGKDIYVAYKLPTGGWGKPSNLGGVINTPYDEDYPFYDEPTHTLYFSSMGHNSMGGYDIFKSIYNDATGAWSQPVNMDFPINTPGDDILFIADTLGQTAFFSSTRSSPDGRIAVYRINVQPHPPENIMITGRTYGDNGKTLTASRITVKDFQSGETIGVFNSTADSGSYIMNLVNGGHFVFTVETNNHQTQSESITIPTQNSLTPIGQQITYEPSTDKLIITNSVQGAVSDSNYLLALNVIQQKAQMEVNVDTTKPIKVYTPPTTNNPTTQPNNPTTQPNNPETQPNNNPTTQPTNPVATNNPETQPNNPSTQPNNPPDTGTGDTNEVRIDTTGGKGVSSKDLVKIARNDAKEQQEAAQNAKDDAGKAIEYASSELNHSQELDREAQEIKEHANNITNPEEKQDSLDKATALSENSKDAGKKAIEAFQLASQMESQAMVKQKEADEATQYSARLDSALKSPDKAKAIKKLQAQRDSLDKQTESNPPPAPSAGDLVRTQARDLKQDSVEVVKHDSDLQKEANRLQQESDDYVSQAQKTDNPNEKVAMLEQARDLANSKKEKENEIQENQKTLVQLHDEYNNLMAQAHSVDSISKNSPSTPLASTDSADLKKDIKNFTPPVVVNNNQTNTQPSNPTTQPSNPVTTNNPETQPNNNPTTTQPSNPTTQPSNPVATNNPNTTQPSNPTTQPNNPVTTNNPETQPNNNPTTTQPSNPTTQPSNPVTTNNPETQPNNNPTTTQPSNPTTQPSNPVTTNNPETQPNNNPTTTQPSNPVTTNNPETQPNNNPTTTQPTNPTTQPSNPVTTNNPETQPNNNPTTTQPSNPTTQPSNPVAINNNPVTQPNNNPTTTQPNNPTTQPSNPVTTNNPETQPNNNPTTTQPSNPITTNNPETQPNNNPTTTQPNNPTTQPSNPVTINNPETQPNNNPTTTQPTNPTTTQPTDPVTTNNPETQPNNNPTTTQPSNPVATNNPETQPNNNPTTTQPSNPETQPDSYPVNNEPTNPVPVTVNYTNGPAAQSHKVANTYTNEANQLSNQAEEARDLAHHTTDPEQAKALNRKADSLDDAAAEQKLIATTYTNDANGAQYLNNQQQLQAWKNAEQTNSSDKIITADLLMQDAQGNYDESAKEKQKADNTTVPYLKQMYLDNSKHYLEIALDKQQKAQNIFLQVNPDLKNVTPETNPVATTNNPETQPNNNPTTTQPNNPTTQPSNPVTTNNPETQPNNNPTTTQPSNPTTQPSNPVTTNNPETQPNNNPTTTQPSNPTTQPSNPVTTNNPETQPNNNPTTTQPSNPTTQPSNPVTTNNPATQPNNNPTTTQPSNPTTQPSNPVATTNNPETQPNNNPTTTQPSNPTTQPSNPVATTNNPANTATASETIDVIRELPASPYSNAHPIPINPPLPEGLVYKVQIGAFRNPIKQTAFKGLEPIAGETTTQGFTRYTAGIFKELDKAKDALTKVQGLGYKDAFIVAFLNGKRVPLNQAATTQPIATNNPATNTQPPVNNTTQPETQPSTNTTAPVASTPVTDVKGLFFTVQVGAFLKPVTADKLYNLQPLFSYKAPNGYIRYNCGIYSTVPKASAAKDAIVSRTPIKDAFVVAYYNGDRIGLPQAAELLSSGKASTPTNPGLDATPAGANNTSATTQPVTQPTNTPVTPIGTGQPINNAPPTVTPADTAHGKVTFSVQVGAYSGQIPLDVANNLIKIASQGIHPHKEDNGITSYTVGEYDNYASADAFKDELATDGFPDCFVVAYHNGKKISLKEAQLLINK